MTVYVLDNDGGWDGFGPPSGAFPSLADALIAHNERSKAKHLPVLTPLHFRRDETHGAPLWTSAITGVCVWELQVGEVYSA